MPIFHPESSILKCWKTLIFIVALYNALLIPFRIAFQAGHETIWLALDSLSDVILILDIGLQFRIGLIENGDYIDDLNIIAKRYRSQRIPLHLLSSFPLDFLARLFLPHLSPVIVGILRLPRLLRLPQSFSVFKNLDSTFNLNPAILRMCQLVIVIFLIDHWVACCWFWIGNPAGIPGKSWLTVTSLHSAEVSIQYMTSLYWAIATLTTVGYGDITPTNPLEVGFTTAIMFLGVSMYAYIIGNVTALISSLDAAKVIHQQKLDQVQAYMRDHQLPPSLKRKIKEYYQYIWEYHRDVRDFHILDDLPYPLKAKVSLYLHRDMIKEVPLFQGASSGFVEEIVMALQPLVLPPYEYVIRQGRWGNEMYFIKRGEVQVFSEETGQIYRNMVAGSFFGEIALVYSSRRTASIKTLTYCELFVIYKADFDQVLEHYPKFAEQIKETAAERYKKN